MWFFFFVYGFYYANCISFWFRLAVTMPLKFSRIAKKRRKKKAGITEQCSKTWGELESGSSDECERHYRQEESCNKKSQVQERGRSRGGGKHRGLQGRLMLELKKQKKKGQGGRFGPRASQGWDGLRSPVCVWMRGDRAASCPPPQLSDLLMEISEGSSYSGHNEGSESTVEGFGKAEDMKCCS